MKKLLAGFLLALSLIAPSAAFGQVCPAVAALPDTERRVTYSPSASTGPFSITFAILGDSTDAGNWLEVWLNGTKLTYTTDWTFSLSGGGSVATACRPITTGQVTLVTAATGTLELVGARRPRRISQFAENQGVSARDLNRVITDIVAENRETWDLRNRTMLTKPGDTITGNLPSAAVRAGNSLCFDAAGNPQACTTSGSPVSGQNILYASQLGVVCDGVTDNTAALAGAVNAAIGAGGKRLIMPGGTCNYTAWNLDGKSNLTIEGATGLSQNTAVIGTALACTRTDAATCLTLTNNRGTILRSMTIMKADAHTGKVIDMSSSASTWNKNALYDVEFRRASGAGRNGTLLYLNKTVEVLAQNIRFSHANIGVAGVLNGESTSDQSATALFTCSSCDFTDVNFAFVNPGLSWTFNHPHFETTLAGTPTVITSQAGNTVKGLGIYNASFSDPTVAGDWMTFNGPVSGFTMHGGSMAGLGGTNGIIFNGTAEATSITGVHFEGLLNAITYNGGCAGSFISGNVFSSVTNRIVNGGGTCFTSNWWASNTPSSFPNAAVNTLYSGQNSADPIFTYTPVLGTVGATGKLGLSGLTSGTITIQPQSAAGTFNFNLPTTAGSAGLCLASAGGGAAPMTWVTCSGGGGGTPGGADTQVQFNSAGVFGGTANLTWVSPKLTIGAAGATGQLGIAGTTSGNVTQTVQAVAGTPTITWGTSTGTPAVTASSPLAITAATGNITCATCGVTGSPLSQFSATTSAQLLGVISDETGSGALVFATSPTLVTPVLGAATATSINGLTITASTGTLTITNGKTAAFSNSITFAGSDATVMTFPGVSASIPGLAVANTFTATQTITAAVPLSVNGSPSTFRAAAGGTSVTVRLNTVTTAEATGLGFQENLTTKWTIYKSTANDLRINDFANSIDMMVFNPGTVAVGSIDFPNTLDASSSTVAAIKISGGLAVAKKVNIGTDLAVGGHITTEGVTATGATGTGAFVFGTSPTIASPTFSGTVAGANTIPLSILAQIATNTLLGNPTAGTANVATVAVPSCSGASDALTWTTSTGFGCNTITAGAASLAVGSSAITGGTTGRVLYDNGGVLGEMTTTGTGTVLVLATSPTLVTPALGTPSSATLTNATGLPISTGVSGLGAGVATFLATPSSANFAAAVTGETGTGALVFGTGPAITAITSLGIRSTGAAFDLTIATSEVLTAGRTLSIVMGDAARTLTFTANASIGGTNTGDQTITLTGDVTGSGTGSFAATIANNAVTLAKMATQATNTILGNATAGTAVPTALAIGSCSTAASAVIWVTNTGFGCNTSITAAAVPASGLTGTTLASNVVTSSITTVGTLVGGATGAGFTIALTTSTVTGTLPAARLPAFGSGDVSFASGGGAGTIAANAVTLAKLATQATNTVLGNATAGTAVPTALAMASCSGASDAVTWTTNTGFGCHAISAGASTLIVGSTTITSGTSGRVLYDNAGVLGEMTTTGSGTVLVLATSPTLVTPALGVATATSLNGLTVTTSTGTLTIANAKTLTVNNILTFAGTDGTTMTFPAASDTVAGLGASQTFTAQNTWTPSRTIASGASAVADNLSMPASTTTITGATNITTATGFNHVSIGIPTYSAASALTITNAATLYLSGAPAGGGAGPATITNAYALWVDAGNARFDGHLVVEGVTSTGATGTGAFVFATSPTLTTPNLGTPSALVLTNATGLPVAGGGTGLASGTSGGILCFTGSTTLASSAALTSTAVIKGGGAGACPTASGVTLDASNNATGFGTLATSGNVTTSTSVNTQLKYSIANTNAGSSASAAFSLDSNDGNLSVVAASTAGGGGSGFTWTGASAISFNASAATGTITFSTNSFATRLSISAAGAIAMPAMAQTLQANVVCFNSGTGLLTYQVSGTGCAASSARFKEKIASLSSQTSLDMLTKIRPVSFKYKKSADMDDDLHFGLIAEEVEKVSPWLMTKDSEGRAHGVKYQEFTAVVIGAIQRLKADNDNLRAELEQIKTRMRK